MNLKLLTNLNIQSIQFWLCQRFTDFGFCQRTSRLWVGDGWEREIAMEWWCSNGWKPQTTRTRQNDNEAHSQPMQPNRCAIGKQTLQIIGLKSIAAHVVCVFNDFSVLFATRWAFNTNSIVLLLATYVMYRDTCRKSNNAYAQKQWRKSYLIEEKLDMNAFEQVI